MVLTYVAFVIHMRPVSVEHNSVMVSDSTAPTTSI